MIRNKNKGIPTEYKGITFRSRFEARVAYWLDDEKIKWEYEPKSFILKTGVMLWPDFYLPELKTWLEVKGNETASNRTNLSNFAKEFKTEVVLIEPSGGKWFSGTDKSISASAQNLYLGGCKKCGKGFFCGSEGLYHCRSCGFYDGDHDLAAISREIIPVINSSVKTQSQEGTFYDA